MTVTLCFLTEAVTEDVLRTCGGSSAAVRGKAKEKSTNSRESKVGSIHKVAGEEHAGCSIHTCLSTGHGTSECGGSIESYTQADKQEGPTSDFSILFWASTCVMISFMLVSRTIPPITISARMLCT